LKIVSYNLRYGGNTSVTHENHWQRLMKDFEPDFVFAQETIHPEKYFSSDEFSCFKSVLYAPVPHGKWGSAILSKHHQLESIALPGFEGWVTGAKTSDMEIGGSKQPVMIFSLHAPSPGPYEPRVNQILDEIAKIRDGSPIIIAGDFNVTTAIRHPSEALGANKPGERLILDRLRREFSLSNAWQTLHPNENLPQTLRWSRDPAPHYHCDAIFVSHGHLQHLMDAKIESADHWGTLSDHNPIVVSFN
jgi:exonuclease III